MIDLQSTIESPQAGALRLTHTNYSLQTIDPNGMRRTVLTDADQIACYNGEPDNYVAPVPSSPTRATYDHATAGDDNNLTFTAVEAGNAGNDVVITLLDPSANDLPLSVYLDPNPIYAGRKVCVDLATGPGDDSSFVLGTGNGEVTITAPDNAFYTLLVDTNNVQSVLGASFDSENNILHVFLATGAGTSGEWLIQDAGTGADSLITVTGPDGSFVDPTELDIVTFESRIPQDIAQPLSIDESEWPNVLILLPTDPAGDVVPTPCSDIATALGEFTGSNFLGDQWTFTPAVADGNWDSYNAPQSVSTPAASPVMLEDGSNSATNVAAIIEAETDFTAVAGGTGADDVIAVELLPFSGPFTGGGGNYAITSTAADVIAGIAGFPAAAALVVASLTGDDESSGLGDGVVDALAEKILGTDGTAGLEIGETTPEVLGTPAPLGRLATDGTDVWTALKDDNTTRQDGWVKTFTA